MISRRSFGSLLLALGLTKGVGLSEAKVAAAATDETPINNRLSRAIHFRRKLATLIRQRGMPHHRTNRDEQRFGPDGAFTKALPHDDQGRVSRTSYAQLRHAINAGTAEAFEAIELGGPKKLKNPLAAFAMDPWGFDACQYTSPPPPALDSEDGAGDILELYWMSLLRDLPFSQYGSSSLVDEAVADLSQYDRYRDVTPDTLFRGPAEGCKIGPQLSQFFYFDIPVGSLVLSQKQHWYRAGLNYLGDESSFRDAESGFVSLITHKDSPQRYQINGRDLATYMHMDTLTQAFRSAALILRFGFGALTNPGNPYRKFHKMDGFATFDYPHLLYMIDSATNLAAHAVWYQKWRIHRRIRPEEVGGLIQNELAHGIPSPLSRSVINSPVMAKIFDAQGTYLLSSAVPEGCPSHPAYPSGHATVGGAAGTILKAFFDGERPFSQYADPVEPNADGTALQSYGGSDASSITINGEIDKLMYNQGEGRLLGGIHWRTDIEEGIRLGEEVAISYLRSMKGCTVEKFNPRIRKIDGTMITI